MESSNRYVPGYISPLTDGDHARLGRIAVLWGQVEYFLDGLIPWVSSLKREELDALGVTERNVGTKVEFLKAANKWLDDRDRAKRVAQFCEIIDNTKIARNHAFHGMWGWRASSRGQSVEPCARQTKYPSRPLKIADLARLEKALCECSRIGIDLLNEFWDWEPEHGAARFVHGSDKGAPKWLSQWLGRNRVNREYLDQTAKAGQLPRLEKPFPRK